jgi:hypothetical protein
VASLAASAHQNQITIQHTQQAMQQMQANLATLMKRLPDLTNNNPRPTNSTGRSGPA